MTAQVTRHNHYVPIWYQKGFIVGTGTSLHHLDLHPDTSTLPDGRTIPARPLTYRAPKSCFWVEDLYTTRFGSALNDEIERFLFGTIDSLGARAVRAFASGDELGIHRLFQIFFEYLDAQTLRTPKGLDWIKNQYPELSQLDLMIEMQALRHMHSTMWLESVREIVSAAHSDQKFIVTDHPVTTYNAAFPPNSRECRYPSDPSIELVGSQTVFALDANNCLILSNLEYAKNPGTVDLRATRTNARYSGHTIARTDTFIRKRNLTSKEVNYINFLLKSRARKYVAASEKTWLNTESGASPTWETIGEVLRPPSDELWHFGGEIIIGYQDGSSHFQDEFGRTSGAHKYLKKKPTTEAERKGLCGCGSGRKFKLCCQGVPPEERPTWDVYSIRERNLMFIRKTQDILGLYSGKTWDDVRRELSDDQVREIHEAFQSLWPEDTDLAALLPRPDEKVLRAAFLGLVDARTISAIVTGWIPYFDEIFIANPFVNAGTVKPDFSPTKSPSKYKAQTLKNVFLLLMLEPYIDAGYVHMVPDPSDFSDIRQVLWRMAKERVGESMEFDEDDKQIQRALSEDDLMRAHRGLPDSALHGIVKRATPDLNPEQISQVISLMREQQKQDPFALLQEPRPGEDGAQLLTVKGFTLEVALFLAQFTGSIVYTDTGLHWNHLHEHATGGASGEPSNWQPVVDAVNKVPFIIEGNSGEAFRIRINGQRDGIKRVLRDVMRTARAQSGKPISKRTSKELAREIGEAKKSLYRAWKKLYPEQSISTYHGEVKLSVPSGGFERTTVRRLLLTYGRAKQIRAMPLAMFMRITRPS